MQYYLSMNTILPWIQIILSVVLILAVLFQRSSTSLGGAFGSGNDTSGTYFTRRGFERFLYYLTIVVTIVFAITAVLAVMQ